MTIVQAASISTGTCDNCPAVHVNLHDDFGHVFATGALPVELIDAFIAQLRAARRDLAMRHAAPERRQ